MRKEQKKKQSLQEYVNETLGLVHPIIIAIPTMVREDGTVRLDFIKLGLYKFAEIIVYCHEEDYGQVSLDYKQFGISNIVIHHEQGIAAIRWFIKDDLDKKYPNYIRFMADDDVSGLEFGDEIEGSFRLPPGMKRTVTDPKIIYEYLCDLTKKAMQSEEEVLSFGPTTTLQWRRIDNVKVKKSSRSVAIKNLVGYPPGKYNPYPKDPEITSLEELMAFCNMRKKKVRPVMRDNDVRVIADVSQRDPYDPDRLYAANWVIAHFGRGILKRHIKNYNKVV